MWYFPYPYRHYWSITIFIQKETKDMLVARRVQAKRDKIRSRKQRLQGDVKCQEGSRAGQSVDKVQKKVSFLWRSRVPDYRDNLQTHLCPSTILDDTPKGSGQQRGAKIFRIKTFRHDVIREGLSIVKFHELDRNRTANIEWLILPQIIAETDECGKCTSDLVMGRVQELLSVSGSFDYEERWSGRSDY